MNRMGTTDILIHKGEKEEKYQLYVEDYVMSFLKNYGNAEDGRIFFYGTKELRDKKYYIYGAGWQKGISYFTRYELLEEITCRLAMDMPVFSIRDDSEIHELAGYYIFYQTNEAMQSYMVEQRKMTKSEEKKQDESKGQTKSRPQDIRRMQKKIPSNKAVEKKPKGGLMAVQLSAIFVILVAIVINSTNSYSKMEELNQAAVEVFFAIENQEAAEEATVNPDVQVEDAVDADMQQEGTVLRLEDLDSMFEEENQAAKQEDEDSEKEGEKQEEDKEKSAKEDEKETAAIEETSQSKQAFARNFAEYYQIEKGDTLNKISIKIYGDTSRVNEICELNQITDPDNIKYGQKILLP